MTNLIKISFKLDNFLVLLLCFLKHALMFSNEFSQLINFFHIHMSVVNVLDLVSHHIIHFIDPFDSILALNNHHLQLLIIGYRLNGFLALQDLKFKLLNTVLNHEVVVLDSLYSQELLFDLLNHFSDTGLIEFNIILCIILTLLALIFSSFYWSCCFSMSSSSSDCYTIIALLIYSAFKSLKYLIL